MPKVLLTKQARDKDAMSKALKRIVSACDERHYDIAAQIGVSPVTLSRWLRDPGRIQLHHLRQIIRVCRAETVDILDLVDGD